jgi:glycosyltransferase involved in cell wall biosynthesis
MVLTISTIVCAYNEADYIGPCLQSLRRQTRPPDEILVVNNASTDETAGLRRTLPACA